MRVVKGVRWELSRIEEKAYYCPRTNPSIRNKRLCTLQWCLKKRTELCPNVAWKSSCLCIETTEDPCHNYRQIYSVGVYHYYCRWNISVGIWQSSKIFTAHATTAKRYSIGDYRWKYKRNDFVGNVLAGNYFFFCRASPFEDRRWLVFLFPIESATEWGITDHQYYDKRIPSVRLSVKMLPTDCVPYTDRINPSVKLFNGVVWRLMKSTTQFMT